MNKNTESIGSAPVPPVLVTHAAEKGDVKDSRMIQDATTPETIKNENVPVPVSDSSKEMCDKKSKGDDNHAISISGPETLENIIDEPVPTPSTQADANAAKQSAFSKFINPLSRKKEAAAPGSTHQHARHYSSKSYHSSSNELDTNEEGLAVACPVKPPENEEPIYEATEYDPSSKTSFYKSTRCRLYTAIAVIFTGAVIAVGVVFGTRGRMVEDEVIVVDEGTETTTMPTTYREFSIRESLEENVLERNATFKNVKKSDPRYLALDWVLNGDKQQLSVDDENLWQRYILALLAFSFDLYSWNCGMVRGAGYCNETDVDDDYTLWLSQTDECLWFGVSCVDGTVQGIDLSDNNLIGEIPPEIGALKSLETLILSNNCLHGTIPPELGKLNSLIELSMSSNFLSGSIPNEFYDLAMLAQLNLAWNRQKESCYRSDGTAADLKSAGLEGEILGPQIAQLSNLQKMSVYENNFSGTVSSEIGLLNQLEYLSANSNVLGGSLPEQISSLSSLKELWLAKNNITGAIPTGIGGTKALETLSLWGLKMNGTIPDSLYNLTNLKALHLRNNEPGFEGPIKSEVGNLLQLEELVLNDNPLLSGTMPSELGRCHNLKEIKIHNTQITGTVPQEVCALTEKNLNLEGFNWSPSFFQADCSPNNESLPPYIVCEFECCSTCCDHTTKVCFDRDRV